MFVLVVFSGEGDLCAQNHSSACAVTDSTIDVKAALLGWGWLPMYLLSLLIAASLPVTLEFATPTPNRLLQSLDGRRRR
jgi:hypothetical protein